MRLVLLLAASIGFADAAHAAPQWGDLDRGPHAVGYRTLRTTDPARRYFDEPRPLQIYVWYPAVADGRAAPMPYGAYLDDAAFDWGDVPDRVDRLRRQVREEFRSGATWPSFPDGLSDAQFEALLAMPTVVVREARPARGRFPVVLHAHMSGALHQSVMLEYLASHGYVVLSVSTYNSAPAFYGRGDETAEALLHLAEDLAMLLDRARALDYADTSRAAVIGMLAHGGLALQMKAAPFAAIACVECLGYAGPLEALPFHDARAVRVPVLEVINSDYESPATGQRHSYMDRFTSAVRYVGRFQGVRHADFYPFPKLAPPGAPHPRYDAVLFTVRRFLDATLRDDAAARQLLEQGGPVPRMPEGFLRVRVERPVHPMPREAEVLGWLRYGEMDRVRAAWARFGAGLVTRSRMFTTVLFLARDGAPHAEEAVTLFRTAFPAREGTFEARQDALLARVLAGRTSNRAR